MNITSPENCDNAPKKLLLRDLNIAFASCDVDKASAYLSPNIIWQTIGHDQIQGLDQCQQRIAAAAIHPIQQLDLKDIITHGRTGAVEGTFTLISDQTFAFANFYRFNRSFTDAKIKHITSFVIETKASE